MNNQIFRIQQQHLVLKSTGEIIPEKEPVFFLRALDTQALCTIRCYQATMTPGSKGWETIQQVIDNFTTFRQENRMKMKPPSEAY